MDMIPDSFGQENPVDRAATARLSNGTGCAYTGAMESAQEIFVKGQCGNRFGKKGRNGTGEKEGVARLGSQGWGVAQEQSALCLIPE